MIRGSLFGVLLAATATIALSPRAADAQAWTEPVRGSWVRDAAPQPGDVALNDVELIVADDAHSAVKQAALFLAGDLEKLTGKKPAIVAKRTGNHAAIHFVTLGASNADAALPADVAADRLNGKWEAYQVVTAGEPRDVWLVGSDPRGTAFAAYTLSERLGIDPLYLWTGYTPTKREQLTLAHVNDVVDSPTVKYRGMFHDDEDILPRPFESPSGYPLRIGDVPIEWYAKFFETALRLRMNMVAPYTRVHRRYEVQKMASDWGLFYTSHHYDVLLSNPFGYGNFKLAEKRGVTGKWDWISNRENMIKYWRAGVEENGALDAIWPVGLRGTDDVGYSFPKDMPESEQNKIFQDVINTQRELAKAGVAKDKQPPVFHFTLYGEMLDKFLAGAGKFEMADDVIIIWPDDNDGRIRALPTEPGKWKHGVYYHLAYYGPVAKQSMHIVPPRRIADEFKKITDAGANEYMLVNVSELREFVREARMIAEITWDAKTALADTPTRPMPKDPLPNVPTDAKTPPPPDEESASADRYVRWFCTEYYGKGAADDAVEAYKQYDALLDKWDRQWWAGDKAVGAVNSLRARYTGEKAMPASAETLPQLKALDERYAKAFEVIERARSKMTPAQRQFFFENCELALRITWRHTQAAIKLVEAMSETDNTKAWAMCEEAMKPLETLEVEIARAEHPPFDRWYAKTFIRHEWTGLNVHQPYEALRAFLSSGGTQRLEWPESYRRPKLADYLPLLKND